MTTSLLGADPVVVQLIFPVTPLISNTLLRSLPKTEITPSSVVAVDKGEVLVAEGAVVPNVIKPFVETFRELYEVPLNIKLNGSVTGYTLLLRLVVVVFPVAASNKVPVIEV